MTTTTAAKMTTQAIDQQFIKVAIQGVKGAFHEIAALNYYQDAKLEIVPAHTFDDVVDFVEKGGKSDTGLMAIENTIAGSLMYNYTLLKNSELSIVGETYLRIQQNLMTLPGVKIEDLKEVHSHPIAIAQCRKFFSQYPHIRLVEMEDTALAAKNVSEKRLGTVGAVASTLAAEMYGLDIIASSIETNKKNFTRFLVLNKTADKTVVEKVNKVSLCFSTPHQVGSLYKVLAVLAAYDVNLTKIQSTPIIGREWEYLFFVDFVINGPVGYQQAINAIRPITSDLRILGAYQTGEHFEY